MARISPLKAAVMMAAAFAAGPAAFAQGHPLDAHVLRDTGKRHGATPPRKSWFATRNRASTNKFDAHDCFMKGNR